MEHEYVFGTLGSTHFAVKREIEPFGRIVEAVSALEVVAEVVDGFFIRIVAAGLILLVSYVGLLGAAYAAVCVACNGLFATVDELEPIAVFPVVFRGFLGFGGVIYEAAVFNFKLHAPEIVVVFGNGSIEQGKEGVYVVFLLAVV